MSSDKVDDLHCGNCGYDGGLAHMQEKLQWQKQLAEVEKRAAVTNDTRQVRAWTLGIAGTMCVLILSVATGLIAPEVISRLHPQPVQPQNPVIHAQEALKDMYEHCVAQATITDRYGNPQAAGVGSATILGDCNRLFGQKIQDMQVMPATTK